MTQTRPAERWHRVKELLADALELPPEAREAYIQAHTVDDAALADELRALLRAADPTRSVLDTVPAQLALDALDEHATRPWLGRRLGPYRLLHLLGQGGMGQVYLAERADGAFEQQVAVKLLRGGVHEALQRERFMGERQILASLEHPNLAKVLDGGVADDGVPWFAMELVHGEPIDVYCRHHGLDVRQRLKLFRTVCQVVHYAHSKGVVHRDLKPANILVGDNARVKLVDFGIAKRISTPQPATATQQRVMTLEYASPEQVRGQEITPASDVFSLGVVLYRLLTDASPYAAATTGSDYTLGQAICDTEPLPPSRTAPPALKRRLRGDLDAMVLMALRKDPQRRYASAEALADDLFRHLEGLPVRARRGAWSYRAGRFMLRHRAMVGAALLANIALVAGLSVAAFEAWRAEQQKVRAERYFASTRKLANVFITEVDKAIEPLPGSTPARKLIVQRGLEYLAQLTHEGPQDASLLLELGSGYGKIGDIQGGPFNANLGDAEGAMRSYEQAVALERQAVAKARELELARAARADLVRQLRSKALLQVDQASLPDALATLGQALEVLREAAAHRPEDWELLKARASLEVTQAQIHQQANDAARFFPAVERAILSLQTLHGRSPDDLRLAVNLANAYGLRGIFRLDQPGASKEAMQQSLDDLHRFAEVLEAQMRKHPGHALLTASLAGANAQVSRAAVALGRRDEARTRLHKALALAEPIHQADPHNVIVAQNLASYSGQLSEILLQEGDVEGSVAAARRALDVYASIPDTDGRISMFDRAYTEYRLAQALSARERGASRPPAEREADHRAACEQWQRSADLLRRYEARFGRHPASPLEQPDFTQALKQCT